MPDPAPVSFADALAAENAAPRRARCTVGVTVDALGADDARQLVDTLADLEIPSTAISRALVRLGHNVKPSTIQRHRKGHCSCPSMTS